MPGEVNIHSPLYEYQTLVLVMNSHSQVPGLGTNAMNLSIPSIPQQRRYLEVAILLTGKSGVTFVRNGKLALCRSCLPRHIVHSGHLAWV